MLEGGRRLVTTAAVSARLVADTLHLEHLQEQVSYLEIFKE